MHMTLLVFGLSSLCLWMPSLARAEGPSLPEDDNRALVSHEEAVKRYIANCRATLTTTAWQDESEITVSECEAYDIHQNCNPDFFDCEKVMLKCQGSCGKPCGTCQAGCGDTCDQCKAACASGDNACIRKCAEARAFCRNGCLTSLRRCRGPDCRAAGRTCMAEGVSRLKECNLGLCSDFWACTSSAPDESGYEACERLLAGQSGFCKGTCYVSMDNMPQDPSMLLEEFERVDDSSSMDGGGLESACTESSRCPADYGAALPYLASFCRGALDDESLSALQSALSSKRISRSTLALIFNAYGAMYGYVFKMEKQLNGFFYGSGEWLPPSCRARIRAYPSAQKMPYRMTLLRDKVKKIWNELK